MESSSFWLEAKSKHLSALHGKYSERFSPSRKVCVYIDDICIDADSQSECKRVSLAILSQLKSHNLVINFEKSEFKVPKIEFLGRIIDGSTKTTKQESIERVRGMQRPIDISTVRKFTGLTDHFRAFIKNYAQIVRPLDRLKQKDVKFVWIKECERAFNSLKEIITCNPFLQLPDPKLPYELFTDASHFGCGSVLYQRDTTQPRAQQLRVIAYQSHTFSKQEINYSITEKEASAVITAIKYFRSYLEGESFLAHTDHIALKHLMELKEPKGRLARWQVFLMSYDVKINHKPGRLLTDADALSLDYVWIILFLLH